MRHVGDEVSLERAMSANVIGTAAYSAPELLLADSPVKKNQVDAATVLKSDVSCLSPVMLSSRQKQFCVIRCLQIFNLFVSACGSQAYSVSLFWAEKQGCHASRLVLAAALLTQHVTMKECKLKYANGP